MWSAVQHDIHVEVLAWGDKYKGLGQKILAAAEYLNTLAAAYPCDIVLFVDSYDVLFTDTLDSMVDTYLAMDAPLVMSAECNCVPLSYRPDDGIELCYRSHAPSPTLYRYFNSGSWIGRAWAAKEMVKTAMQGQANEQLINMNDQGVLQLLWVQGELPYVALDHYAQLFVALYATTNPEGRCIPGEDLVVLDDGRVFNRHTGSTPGVVHLNGPTKEFGESVNRKMWWERDNARPSAGAAGKTEGDGGEPGGEAGPPVGGADPPSPSTLHVRLAGGRSVHKAAAVAEFFEFTTIMSGSGVVSHVVLGAVCPEYMFSNVRDGGLDPMTGLTRVRRSPR